MRIPIHIDRRLSGAPGPVMEALRHAGLWHEKDIPEIARAAGVRSLEVTSRGQRFVWKLYLSRSRGRYAPPPPRLRGRVQPDGEGTRVMAVCGRSRVNFVIPSLITLPFLAGAWLSGTSISAVLIPGVVWIVSVAYYTTVSGDYESDVEFLLSRFDDVLRPFGVRQ